MVIQGLKIIVGEPSNEIPVTLTRLHGNSKQGKSTAEKTREISLNRGQSLDAAAPAPS